MTEVSSFAVLNAMGTALKDSLGPLGYAVKVQPRAGGTGAWEPDILVTGKDRTVAIEVKGSTGDDDLPLGVLGPLSQVSKASHYPSQQVVLISVSKIPGIVRDELAKNHITFYEYPKVGLKEITRSIQNLLASK
jgi:hypothetical protein